MTRAVVDYDQPSVTTAAFHFGDDTISRGMHCVPIARGDIETGMKSVLATERIQPIAKKSRNSTPNGRH